MVMRVFLMTLILAVVSLQTVLAGNWPQWRGPTLDGVSQEKQLPLSWDRGTNITWELTLPSFSGSTPIVWGESIFLNIAEGKDLYLWSINRRRGALQWKQHLDKGNVKIRKQNMSSPSPVTDGHSVYVMTGTGILKTFNFKGNTLWTRDIQKDYGKFGLNHGYASSPLLHQGALFIQVLHGMKTDDPSYVTCVDAKNGKTIWKIERPTAAIRESPDSYTTPTMVGTGDNLELVITGGDCATGHDPTTGRELWRVNGFNPMNNPYYRVVASPVAVNGLIYVPTRVKPLITIRHGGRGDVSQTHRLWDFENGPDVPTPVVDGIYFYSVSDNGVMWCLDANNGKKIWGGQRLKPAIYSSSPVLADGKLYVTNENGLTTIVKAGPNFQVLAENPLNDYCLSSPAISDGQIFIRTAKHLFCIGPRR